ncbi:MAG: hypothetical protein L3J63_04395 [Geopsychrobacter sp.]|nr:hypothetical protein [Geopsychrobacter sp.]
MMKRILLFTTVCLVLTLLSACGGGSSSESSIVDTTVVNWLGVLNEGESMTWSLTSGTYRLEMTSTPNGGAVTWTPSTGCQNFSEVTAYAYECTLPINGQLKITNPTTFGLGPSETVTAKVTKK